MAAEEFYANSGGEISVPVRGCKITFVAGSPLYNPYSRTTSSDRQGFGLLQPVKN